MSWFSLCRFSSAAMRSLFRRKPRAASPPSLDQEMSRIDGNGLHVSVLSEKERMRGDTEEDDVTIALDEDIERDRLNDALRSKHPLNLFHHQAGVGSRNAPRRMIQFRAQVCPSNRVAMLHSQTDCHSHSMISFSLLMSRYGDCCILWEVQWVTLVVARSMCGATTRVCRSMSYQRTRRQGESDS